jgi:hypothetical protein
LPAWPDSNSNPCCRLPNTRVPPTVLTVHTVHTVHPYRNHCRLSLTQNNTRRTRLRRHPTSCSISIPLKPDLIFLFLFFFQGNAYIIASTHPFASHRIASHHNTSHHITILWIQPPSNSRFHHIIIAPLSQLTRCHPLSRPTSHVPHPTSHIPHPTSHIPSHIPHPTSHIPHLASCIYPSLPHHT